MFKRIIATLILLQLLLVVSCNSKNITSDNNNYNANNYLYTIKKNNKYGFINSDGKIVIKPIFEEVASEFEDGVGVVVTDGKFGLIDMTGKVTSSFDFDLLGTPKEKLLLYRYGNADIGESYGYIDISGNIVIKDQYTSALSFSEGFANVIVNGKFGYIDKNGSIIIEPEFEYAGPFVEGLAAVKIDGKWGYINKKGNFVVEPKFDRAMEFINGLAKVYIDRKFGYIDKEGKYIWQPTE